MGEALILLMFPYSGRGVAGDLASASTPSGAGDPVKLSPAAVRRIQVGPGTSYIFSSSLTQPLPSLSPQKASGCCIPEEGNKGGGAGGPHPIHFANQREEGSHAPAQCTGATVCPLDAILQYSAVGPLWKPRYLYGANQRNAEILPGTIGCKL